MKTENLNLELTVQEVNILLTSLSEMPYKISNNLIQKITEQSESQLKKNNEQ